MLALVLCCSSTVPIALGWVHFASDGFTYIVVLYGYTDPWCEVNGLFTMEKWKAQKVWDQKAQMRRRRS